MTTRDETRRRFQSPLRLFNYVGRPTSHWQLCGLQIICARLSSTLIATQHACLSFHSFDGDWTGQDGHAGSLAPGRSRWSEDNSSQTTCVGYGHCSVATLDCIGTESSYEAHGHSPVCDAAGHQLHGGGGDGVALRNY